MSASPAKQGLWDSQIELGEKFFEEIIRHSVPLDMNILKAMKRSSLGIDLYLWLDLPDLLSEGSAAALLAASLPSVRSDIRSRRETIVPWTTSARTACAN